MKQYIGSCVDNPFKDAKYRYNLLGILLHGREIVKRTFFKHCELDPELVEQMKHYPRDYCFYKFKNVYWFTNSAIEYFYI